MHPETGVSLAAVALMLFGSACVEPPAPSQSVRFSSVSAGDSHTCGLSVHQRAYCWGSNCFGQLGAGGGAPQYFRPLAVAGGLTLTAVSAGGLHTCGLDDAGRAYCWGRNSAGQLGTASDEGPETCGAGPCATSPVAVASDLTFKAISAGWAHTCGITLAGDLHCWGDNQVGQIGIDTSGENVSSPAPLLAESGLSFVTLSSGESSTCALTDQGQTYCWGENRWTQAGPSAEDTCFWQDGTPIPCSTTPKPAAEGLALVAIAAGDSHTCGLTADAATFCWGYGGAGQLGVEPDSVASPCPFMDGLFHSCSSDPLRVTGEFTLTSLAAGGSHNCALLADGQAYCWGGHLIGQLGDCSFRDYSALPRPVCGGHRFSLLDAGGLHTCGISTTGEVYCWGGNDVGQLGSLTFTAFGPVKVAGTG